MVDPLEVGEKRCLCVVGRHGRLNRPRATGRVVCPRTAGNCKTDLQYVSSLAVFIGAVGDLAANTTGSNIPSEGTMILCVLIGTMNIGAGYRAIGLKGCRGLLLAGDNLQCRRTTEGTLTVSHWLTGWRQG